MLRGIRLALSLLVTRTKCHPPSYFKLPCSSSPPDLPAGLLSKTRIQFSGDLSWEHVGTGHSNSMFEYLACAGLAFLLRSVLRACGAWRIFPSFISWHAQDREREKELLLIKQQYLGTEKVRKKTLKPSEKFRFNFDWEAQDDTSKDLNPLYNNTHEAALLFGRGLRAGVDRREQMKAAAAHQNDIMKKMRQSAVRCQSHLSSRLAARSWPGLYCLYILE